MGKKTKIGKRRKDKFYHLAKETGYRARSAFKLIQLNRKYHFLQKCRVLIDLCAAPGGWLQVAAKSMPISSLIIGVDLVPIKPIANVITFEEDITTDRCRQQLQRQLKMWKADCVLNDGSPNVGSAWVQDAFSQAELTLSALKLACEFLREGGWFITKVFRSKEYQPLMWVLQQLFKKVDSTKPQASRIESAEIFVVCQGYLAPSKIDPKLLNPRHVFQEVEESEKGEQKISLTKLQKPRKAAEGYPDNSHVLFKSTSVADFITGEDYLTILGSTHQLCFDRLSEVFAKHPLTTDDIRQYCEDIQVLGPKELKQLVKWRHKLRLFLDKVAESEEEGEEMAAGVKREGGEEDLDDDGLEGVDAKVKALEREEAAEVKRERRRLRKEKRKLKERLVKKGDMHKEVGEIVSQEGLFRLKDIRSKSQLEKVEKGEEEDGVLVGEEEEGSDSEGESIVSEGEEDEEKEEEGEEEEEEEEEEEGEEKEEEEEEEEEEEKEGEEERSESSDEQPLDPALGNPLVVPLESTVVTRSKRAKLWFSKPVFETLEIEQDEEEELQQMVRNYESRGGHLWSNRDTEMAQSDKDCGNSSVSGDESDVETVGGEETDEKETNRKKGERDLEDEKLGSESSDETDSSDSDSDINSVGHTTTTSIHGPPQQCGTFEIVPMETRPPVRKLDPEGLAIGALIAQSKKKREDLIESAYNRWTHNDENLPDWFLQDESKFCQKQLPVSKEMVQEYCAKLKEVNARPINKIAQAKARKKRKIMKKMEKARKQIETITDAVDVTDREKVQQIKQIYKKAGVLGKRKRNVQYVVAKKGQVGRRVGKPAGVKGAFKLVDPRMKKDKRGLKRKQKKKRKH